MKKVKKPFYKKWWFWIAALIVCISVLACGDAEDNNQNDSYDNTTVQKQESVGTEQVREGDKQDDSQEIEATIDENKVEQDVPTEYKSALKRAEIYSDYMDMSKAGIFKQLTSEYGDKFSEEAAQYAVDNLKADYKENALSKAKIYQSEMAMSPNAIYDQLTSQYGEQFTEEEAQYAIDNLE